MLFDSWFGSVADHLSSIEAQIHNALAAHLPSNNTSSPTNSSLGTEYVIDDAGQVTQVQGSSHHNTTTTASSSHGGWKTTTTSPPPPPPPPPPAGTLVGTTGGFQVDLIWDASVSSAPSGFEQTVIAAAQAFTNAYTNAEVVNIHVGYGEVAGTTMASGDLGQSESYGYLTSYATVANALAHDNYPVVPAANAPTGAQFFLTSALAKTLGLISATSTSTDGFIGLSGSYPMNWSATGPAAGSSAYSGVGIAEHEIAEVLGRLGLEGRLVNSTATYTPLDLFNYAGAGHLELSANGGYFSVTGGTTGLGHFNNGSNGGDIGDWATGSGPVSNDAFNAFSATGPLSVSSADYQEMAALGYKLSGAGLALA